MSDRLNYGMTTISPTPSQPPHDPPFSLRIDLSAHNAARIRAQEEGCSVSDILLRALRLGLSASTGDPRHHG